MLALAKSGRVRHKGVEGGPVPGELLFHTINQGVTDYRNRQTIFPKESMSEVFSLSIELLAPDLNQQIHAALVEPVVS
mgnify:CR=1 FL=1